MIRGPISLWVVVVLLALATTQASAHPRPHGPVGSSTHTHARGGAANPVAAVSGLIDRVLPQYSQRFFLELIPAQDNKDVMQVASQGSQIVLRGSSAIALASAFNWYLNDFCNTTYDWSTYALSIPDTGLPLPPPQGTPIKERITAWTYYMNVCTYGYSLAFVSWDYWVKHIDWMAMNGINLPLAFVGQELIMVRLFMENYNLTLTDMQAFISGPAFLPWYRMGNVQGWGGPIPTAWLQSRYQLQRQILARMRELGMTPVLSAFAGHIPEALVKNIPSLNVTRSSDWCGFPPPYGSVYLLESTDAHFQTIGSLYLQIQEELYGTDHVYNCDTFNEMNPRSNDPAYLTSSSRAVYAAMALADPDAIWLMQGWLFRNAEGFWQPAQIQAYLGGVPNDKMWILDLSANDVPIWQRTNSFYGKPFIWCNLLNYGGAQGLNGDLPAVYKGINTAAQLAPTMIGVGITMEGIWQNYPSFEYTLRFGWFNATPDNYIIDYASRRYGAGASPDVIDAWRELLVIAYSGDGSFGSPITQYPVMAASVPQWLARMQEKGWASPEMMFSYYTALNSAPLPADLVAEQHKHFGSGDACPYGQVNNVYLADYPSGYDPVNPPYDAGSLAQAEAWCQAADVSCGGITLHNGHYEARAGWTALPSPSSEISWIKLCVGPLVGVWQKLLSARAALGPVPSYRYDVVDVTREVLSGNFSRGLSQYRSIYAQGSSKYSEAATLATSLMDVINDYDTILSSDANFMLGPFISDARAWGTTPDEESLMEFNARNQLTLWGPTGQINDYAAKSWGGLVRGYYAQRWQLFFNISLGDLQAGQAFSQAVYDSHCYSQVEQPFQTDRTAYPVVPEHDAVAVAAALYAKYVGPLE